MRLLLHASVRGILCLCLAAGFVRFGAAANAESIVVGQIGPFTGLPSSDATEINAGAQAYFDQINAAGGIGGKKIEFFNLDDKFSGDEFAKQLEVASAKKPVALITPIGVAGVQKTLAENLLEKYDLLILNTIPGADIFRKPGQPRLFHVRASDSQQIAKVFRHAKTVGINSITLLYQDFAADSGALVMAEDAAKQLGMKVVGVKAKHEDAALAASVAKVAEASPLGVLVTGSPKFAADAIAQLRKTKTLTSIFALSYLQPRLVAKVVGDAGARGVGIAQTFPNPMDRTLLIQQDFHSTMKTFAPLVREYTAFHFEGYVCARVLIEAFKRGGAASPTRLAQTLRSMGPLDLGGFAIDFSKGNAGSSFVDIGVVTTGGKLMY